jgi:[histone H3]-lysine4 N-trimethyltransferase ATXR3
VEYARAVLAAVAEYSIEVFRIHPKGTGVVCINPAGIPPHTFVSEYLGELYPAYRWCERLDVVEQAQQAFELKPALADFYNILLERPRQDPNGYGTTAAASAGLC